jgi:hypothetical protein
MMHLGGDTEIQGTAATEILKDETTSNRSADHQIALSVEQAFAKPPGAQRFIVMLVWG